MSVTLRVDGLSKTYGEGERAVQAVKQVTFATEPGEFVAVVGPSGSGKTTLLAMIGGLLTPTEGGIQVNGRDIARLNRGQQAEYRRKSVGYVFQANNLLPFLSARENLLVMAQITGAPRKAARARAAQLLEELGLTKRADALGSELSGGERQRVAIARAILKNPTILILDEATNALDTVTERLVQDAINRLMANRTTFAIAHRLSTIRNANQILVLDRGVIVERGTHEQLFAAGGAYRRLCDMQTME